MSTHISAAAVRHERKRRSPVETSRTTILRITPCERDTLQLLADGSTSSELSRHFGLGASEIDSLLERLFAVMGVATRTEAIAAARKRGLRSSGPPRRTPASRSVGQPCRKCLPPPQRIPFTNRSTASAARSADSVDTPHRIVAPGSAPRGGRSLPAG